jgi:ferredoxin
MPKTISEQNLRRLVDAFIQEGTRVVGPKGTGDLTLFEPLTRGEELELTQLPRRSGKETFFPLCENILSYEKKEGKTTVHDVDLDQLPETVLIGSRPCDAAAAPVLDAVFSWDYKDEFFLARREKTTVIGLACTSADDACFCTAVGLSPADARGSDLFLLPLEGNSYRCQEITAKGSRLLARHPELLTEEEGGRPLPLAEPAVAKLDLKKIKAWLDNNFASPFWTGIAERCVGCGACAFLCPACHCFDINDEGSEQQGQRRKHWDACAFGKFTNHASGHNPRDIQANRYRNRVMHKFKYYDDKFKETLCTGCGRCIRACPVGIDIKEILDEIEKQ